MRLAIRRFLSVYLATYFLIGNLGVSFTQSTCLFTGNIKYSFSKAISCCSKKSNASNQGKTSSIGRAKCCSYDLYALKFNFDQSVSKLQKHSLPDVILATTYLCFFDMSVAPSIQELNLYYSNHSPPPLGTRLATLQVYQI